MTAKLPVETKTVIQNAFEWLDRLILSLAKASLLVAAITTFLPVIFRAGLRQFSQRRNSGR